MDERYAIWNNTIKKQLPEAWNTRLDTPATWKIKEGPCSLWETALSLPAEWGNNKSSPDMWHHVETPPCGWETELHLRDDWGSPNCRPPSVRKAASGSKEADKQGSGIDLSAMARSGAGKLSGIAGKVGSVAKSAADSALDHARSDEMKNRLSSVKDKAGALAGSAGSSLKNLKDGAGDFVYKYHPAKKDDAAAENKEVIAAIDDGYDDADTVVSSYIDNTADEQDYAAVAADDGYEQIPAEGLEDNYSEESVYVEAPDAPPEEECRSERSKCPSWARTEGNNRTDHSSDPAWAHSASTNPYARANDNYSPAYVAPDSSANYSYSEQKRSPVVFVLLGVIGVLILGVGLLGGMLLMKDKNSSDHNVVTSDVSGDTAAQTDTTEAAVAAAVTTEASAVVTEAAAITTVVTVQKIVKDYPAGDVTKYPQYIKVLKDNLNIVSNSVKFKGLHDISNVSYALCDINSDNTPELVILAGNPDIYTIYSGDAVELTPFWGANLVKGIFVYENGYIGMTSISGNGEGSTTYYRFNGTKDLEAVVINSFNLDTRVWNYTNNGQTITEEEFEQITAQFGKEVTFSSTPVTDISEIKTYVDKSKKDKYTSYDPSAAGSDFSFSQGKTECTVNTETDDLNLRAAPSTNGDVILTIPKGAVVYEYGHNSEWSYISYNKGGTTYYGYASRRYISKKNASYTTYDTSAAGSDFSFSQGTIECRINIESGELNLRGAPSMNGEVIVLMPKGATVYEYGHNHVWSYISYTTGGTTYYGYANKQYLSNTNERIQVVSCNKKGTINASNGEVAGFASSYVVDGGPSKLIRKTLDHGWHVTAVNYCYSKGILWYELYDTDDNDYYGWVDASFISFY